MSLFTRSGRITWLLASVWMAASAQEAPSIRVSGIPAQGLVETAGSSITLEGSITAPRGLAGVTWTDQAGRRGPGQFEAVAGSANEYKFVVGPVGLRRGLNGIHVAAVDPEGGASSVHVHVLSQAPEEPEAERRVGHWQNQPVTYELVNGKAVVEGDILLGPEDRLAQEPPQGKSTEGKRLGLSVLYSNGTWPVDAVTHVAKVPYVVLSGTTSMTTAISQFNTIFSGLIQFVPRAAEADYVAIDLNSADHSRSCFATLGRTGGQQDLQGSIDCDVATLLHEMGHSIGLYHEHQRPDFSSFITFNQANLDIPLLFGNFGAQTLNARNVGLYDYASIMHYGAAGFSKNNQMVLETIPAGMPIGEATTFSAGDIDTVKRIYGTAPASVTITTNPVNLPIVVDGVALTAPQTFAWAMASVHTIAVPAGSQKTSPADGSRYFFGNWNDGGAQSHQITVTSGTGGPGSPVASPAITVYQASFQRYNEINPGHNGVTGLGGGTLSLNPLPQSISGGSYYLLRQKVTGQALPNASSVFAGWFGNDYLPRGANPREWIVQASPWNIQADLEPTTAVYTVSSTFTNPAPPTSPLNPAVTAIVDGVTHVIPEIFRPVDGWTAGSAHTLNVTNLQTPVTTNVAYKFNNWNLGGTSSATAAQSINIPAASTSYVASFTPSYRGYSLVNPFCAANAPNPPLADQKYLDGTVVNFQVNPKAQWFFTGFSGTLNTTANPQSLTVHDEFAVTANLNTVAAPLTITGFAPASLTQGAASTMVTITGTGFTPSSVVFVNGSYSSLRTVVFVDAQHVQVQLGPADLTAPGGFPIGIQNAANGCSVFVEGSFTVNPATPHWQITKTHTGNFTQGGTGQYSITVTNNGGASTSGLVTVTETVPAGMTLTGLSGSGWSCTANSCTTSTALAASASYPVILANVSISSSAAIALTNQVSVTGGSAGSGLASDPTTIVQVPATITAVGGGGQTGPILTAFGQQLQAAVRDAGGAGIPGKLVTFSAPASGASAAFTSANPATTNAAGIAAISVSANGVAGGPYVVSANVSGVVPAAQFSLTNSLGTNVITFTTIPSQPFGTPPIGISATASSGLAVSFTSNTLAVCTLSGSTVTLLTPGDCSITARQPGNANFSAATPVTQIFAVTEPSMISVAPASGSGALQTFTGVYSASKAYTDLQWVQLLLAVAPDGGGQPFCYVHYDVQGNAFWLYGAGGFFVGPIAPGTSSNLLQNSLCALNTSASTASGTGKNLTVNASLVFKAAGARNVYMRAMNKAQADSGWILKGTWTAVAATLGTMSATPNTGKGSPQTFTLTYPDPAGFAGAAYGWTQFLVAKAPDGAGQPFCYVHYDRAGNGLWMYSGDVGFFLGPVTPGVASNALDSSSCSISSAGTTVSNQAGNLVLNVPITFKAPMSGGNKEFQRTLDVLNRDSGWQQTGNWTAP
ncbi:M12 family metallopeptidase [Paludibaculum fermentans]|uniref:M12 family metallopeptidase n=1 Tax=Paludibaculum fermentans TaxID=1473598 RepID=UPI003EBA089E